MTPPAPAVSIVMPTRNRRRMLSEAMSTVREQSFADWAMIVVDDASDDDTEAWLATQAEPRLRVIRLETPGGRDGACNRGLAEARGEFVMFLDEDDLLRPDVLADLVAALRAYPEAIAATAPRRVLMPNGDSFKPYWPARRTVRPVWRELLFGMSLVSGQILLRTDAARKLGGFPALASGGEDGAFWFAIARLGPFCMTATTGLDHRVPAGEAAQADPEAPSPSVWNDIIATLPRREVDQARRIRRAAESVDAAVQARRAGQYGRALWRQLAACGIAPYLLASPWTRRPIWWGIKKCLRRQSAP